MRKHRTNATHWLWLLATALILGCSSSSETASKIGGASSDDAATADTETTGEKAEPASDTPFQLGDLIERFDPPPLEELDKSAEWIDRPVLDGTQQLREQLAAAGPPPVTVEEALALRNDSAESNEKIEATLGRMPPADGAGVNYETTWVKHAAGDLKSSNPIFVSSQTEAEYQAMTALNGGALLNFDRNLKYFASSASIVSWQTSKDRKIDKFVLRDDLLWSDGKPLTAYDFEFAFQVIMTKAVPVLALQQNMLQVRWVKAYDDHTLVVFHKEPFATNMENMANFPAFPQHVYEKSIAEDPLMSRSEYHANLEDHPVVGGPYELVRRVRNQEFVLRPRESYYMHDGKQVRPKPYFAEIRVKVIEDLNTALLALKAGQLEEMMLRAEQWNSQTADEDFYERNTKVTAVQWGEFHFTWNLQSPLFSDVQVREAMSWAMDYDELLHTICQGLYQPARGPYHPTSPMFPKDGPQPYHQDLAKAGELLDAAGWTDSDGDGIRDKEINGRLMPFEFTLLTYQTETGVQTATLMKSCLDQLGIVCNVKPTEFTVLVDSQQKHKFEAAMGGWLSGNDADTSANLYVTGEGRNYGHYSNPTVDELFEKGRRETDPEKRAAIYGEIHNLLWKDQPYTWLFYRNAFYAFNKKLRGYNFAPTGPYYFDPGINGIYRAK